MVLPNSVFFSARGRSGGMWVLWMVHVRLTMIEESRHYFFCRIHPPDKPPWVLACVYGDASYRDNPKIWRAIQRLVEVGWIICCIGDFNAITEEAEKFGGSQRLNQNSRRFKTFIFTLA
jgi:hypothetical protein